MSILNCRDIYLYLYISDSNGLSIESRDTC